MADATPVATNGFSGVPSVPGHQPRDPNPAITGGQNLPPLNPTPGFNPPAGTPVITSQTTPPAQAPAAPVQQPAPQVPPTTTKELVELSGVPTANLRDFNVGEINDPVIKSTASILLATSPDLDLDRALANAIKFGNADLIDVAYLKEKGGVQADNLITIAKSLVTQIANVADASEKAVFALAGGEQGWATARTAFNTHAPAAQRATIAQLLDSGNPEFVAYAAQTVIDFAKASGAVPFTGQQVQTGQASVAASQGLSKQQFQAELGKLDRYSATYAQDSNDLLARRQLGKNLGL